VEFEPGTDLATAKAKMESRLADHLPKKLEDLEPYFISRGWSIDRTMTRSVGKGHKAVAIRDANGKAVRWVSLDKGFGTGQAPHKAGEGYFLKGWDINDVPTFGDRSYMDLNLTIVELK
jgi:hypothetical protein